MRLIDADVALQTAYTIYFEREADVVADVLSDCPTIDPASLRPKGEWMYHTNASAECSICGGILCMKYDFCPNCGADMRKEAHNEC